MTNYIYFALLFIMVGNGCEKISQLEGDISVLIEAVNDASKRLHEIEHVIRENAKSCSG